VLGSIKIGFIVAWEIELIRGEMLGFIVTAISFVVVGHILRALANLEIWAGRIGGKVLFVVVSQFVSYIICWLTRGITGEAVWDAMIKLFT
jgi:hypothetical protein